MTRTALALASLALTIGAIPHADVAHADIVPPPRRMLVVGDAHVVEPETDAPREERGRAVSEARRSMEGFLGRISRCMDDHGGFVHGQVRARVVFDRAVLPTRTRTFEGPVALRACVAEVLPSIALEDAPHGRITIEIRVAAIDGW